SDSTLFSTRLNFAAASSVRNPNMSPVSCSIYPNPCSEASMLHFSLAEPSVVRLSLVNEAGEICRTLDEMRLTQGEHSIPIATHGLAAGTYYVKVESTLGNGVCKLSVR